MTNVTAEYTLNSDGSIKVVNSGYVDGKLKQIIGRATTTDKDDVLKVSFFSGIENDYKILAIDKEYQCALIGGQNPDLLWILSRKQYMHNTDYKQLVEIAKKYGYNYKKLTLTR